MHSKGISQRDRPSRMHHRKNKNGNGATAVGKLTGRKECGVEAMAKLRYLNKKPLCLQYNVPNSSYARRYSATYGSKRKDPSFVVVILFGLCRFVHWAAKGIQKATVDFLVKPADELFPNELSNQCFGANFSRAEVQLKRRPAKRAIVRRSDISRMIQSLNYKSC